MWISHLSSFRFHEVVCEKDRGVKRKAWDLEQAVVYGEEICVPEEKVQGDAQPPNSPPGPGREERCAG
ncbi:hypothetical protein AMJ40_06640 [candidate division TA06 bacterium DG_26]|uniref:Uncharacterized protein n=1 Tax=candidate division TA06 bacterium DG_26 TaxID=1703771 RepID=A0A0S7WFJ7_UNCT6|nr:MAG: hypothetical protein AMJ40_06640 [candidate division TA06 bacterium DG_26]